MKKNTNAYQLSVAMTKEEHEVILSLKNEYHINISSCVKCLLKQKLEEQEKIKQDKHEN